MNNIDLERRKVAESKVWPLVERNHPLLATTLDLFDFSNPPVDPVQLSYEMIATLHHYKGIALSANQLGLPYRVFVMAGEPNYVCFNPKIVDQGTETQYLKEGCLSYPNVLCKIKRPTAIKVRFTIPTNEVVTAKFAGVTARMFQHELDLLDGISFLEKASYYHREQALNKAKILNRRQNDKS